MRNIAHKTLALAATTLVLLTACGGGGGGGDGGSPVTGFVGGTDVPIGAEQNVGDVISFARQQIAATSESSDPVVVGDAKLATDDSAEPVEL